MTNHLSQAIAELPLGAIRASDVLFLGSAVDTCSRCQGAIGEFEVPMILIPRSTNGAGQYVFCQRCSYDPDSDRCERCGCSDTFGCDGGCGWVAPGLCSACADESEVT